LVEALSETDSLVFDPFGGIGTTAVEALRLGRKAWCVDQNPIGNLASYVMSGLILAKAMDFPMPLSTFVGIERLLNGPVPQPDLFVFSDDRTVDTALDRVIRPTSFDMLEAISTESTPSWDLLRPWFEPNTIQEVKKIHSRLLSSEMSAFGKLVGLLMISASLRPACSQTRSWGHIADNVLPDNYERKEFSQVCRRWLYRACGVIARACVTKLTSGQKQAIRVWISSHDWRSDGAPPVRPPRKCDLLITSPPYSGAIDYTRAQRLSLYLIGFKDADISAVGQHEIGARRKRSSAQSESVWASELGDSLRKQLSWVDPGAPIVIVLPHNDHGREEGAVRMGEVLREAGWKRAYCADRSIRKIRARQSWTSIKRETLEVYQKTGAQT
jgi:hypothetical protein